MSNHLKRTLSPLMVWGLGVGYVISGNYFGWNLGLEKGGTLGLGIALVFIITLYITFTFSYTELACAIPKAGGAFDYVTRAFGARAGFITGVAQNIEFTFAPPAIASGIGAYFQNLFPATPSYYFSLAAYLIFFLINARGVKLAATVELIVTSLAVAAVVLFCSIAAPHVSAAHLQHNAWPAGWEGVFAAVPFAIWFFLGIEGVANLGEEAINPQRTLRIGFVSAMATLVALCLLTFVSSIGIGGWEAIVFTSDGQVSDAPLPLAMMQIVGADSWQHHAVVIVGLFGLVASFHGLMLAGGRSLFEFAKAGFAPAVVGKIHARYQTPANALLANMIIGMIAVLAGKTGELITLSVFGALFLYGVSMAAMIKLRKAEPQLSRPFVAPLYPLFPIVALVIAAGSFVAMTVYNLLLAGIFFLMLAVSFIAFRLMIKKEKSS